jgi:TolB-like protein/Tfp pilus assembly protein PilF
VAPAATSVAVLYWQTRDTADTYLADGLTEDIATSLGRVTRVQVKAPSSVRRAQRATPGDMRGIGRALNVRYVLDGGLRRVGGAGQYRVTVRLVRVDNETAAWGETYDRTADQLLELPAVVAQAVATTVAGSLNAAENSQLGARPTRDPRAYDHLLRGNFYLAKRTEQGISRAIDEYEQASRMDGGLTEALARTGMAYSLAHSWGSRHHGLPPESLLALGSATVNVALRQDSMSSYAWMARAMMLREMEPFRSTGMIAAHQRALALDPRNAEAWFQYGADLRDLGRDSAAMVAWHRSLEIDPDRPITLHNFGFLLSIQGHTDAALPWLDSALAVDPDFVFSRLWRVWLLARLGRLAEARQDAERLDRIAPGSLSAEIAWLPVDMAGGDTAAARRHAEGGMAAVPDTITPTALMASFIVPALVLLGDRERALAFLERVRPRSFRLRAYLQGPATEAIRSDPRFMRVMDESRPPGVREP